MPALVLRTTEFVFYHVLLSLVEPASRLPRDTTIPEAMRLYRENVALKAPLDALERHLVMLQKGRRKGPRATLRPRVTRVFTGMVVKRGKTPTLNSSI
jgi:hypothetical protein